MAAIPRTASFEGQVIARWHEDSESENTSSTVSYIAVDEGQRAWTFTGTELFSRVGLGDLATVTVKSERACRTALEASSVATIAASTASGPKSVCPTAAAP